MARSAATRAEPPARRPPPLRAAALCASLVAASAAAQALLPLANYQIIIDRKPFGELAAPRARGQDPDAAQAAQQEQQEREQQALARQIDLVAVNITLRGTISVGFVDKSVKPASSHYLSIGETENGYTVEAADYAAETATISKGGVRITLKLGSGIVSETPDENAPSTTPAAAGAGAPDETAPQPPPAAQRRQTSSAAPECRCAADTATLSAKGAAPRTRPPSRRRPGAAARTSTGFAMRPTPPPRAASTT